jgi:hypothetical protein
MSGFGLPHTDENFYNKDLGNCLDYTIHPAVNKQPDHSNYLFLEKLYGDVPGSQPSNSTMTSQNATAAPSSHGSRLRGLRRVDSIPDWILAKWNELDVELENHSHNAERRTGWRLLHADAQRESLELDIGEGYSIRVNKLLVL